MNHSIHFNDVSKKMKDCSDNMLIEEAKDQSIKKTFAKSFNIEDNKENIHPNINATNFSNINLENHLEKHPNLLLNQPISNDGLIKEHQSGDQYSEESIGVQLGYVNLPQHVMSTTSSHMSNYRCESSQYLLITNTCNDDLESINTNLTVANCMNNDYSNSHYDENTILNSNHALNIQTAKSLPQPDSGFELNRDSLANFSCSQKDKKFQKSKSEKIDNIPNFVAQNKLQKEIFDYSDDSLRYVNYLQYNSQYQSHFDFFNRFQEQIDNRMLQILFDWIIELHYKFKMRQETLHLTISLVNRILCEVKISKAQLQLLGVTTFFMASKIEEIYPPKIKELVYLTNNAYSKQDVQDFESMVICKLDFNFSVPYSCFFQNYWLIQLDFSKKASLIAQYYCENALITYNMRKYSSSVIAWACICLAQDIVFYGDSFHTNLWDQYPLDVKKQHIQECGTELLELVSDKRRKNYALYKKFSQAQYDFIASSNE